MIYLYIYPSQQRMYHCDKFKDLLKTHLERSMERGIGEVQYQSSAVSKQTYYSTNLERHTEEHTGEKPCECSYYGKGFNQQSNLFCHLLILPL